MKNDENVWNFFQNHLGYNDEEMKIFKEDPKNQGILSKSVELMNKTIVVEVVESHGCSDVSVQCGGWGRIVMEIRMEDRKK